MFNGIRNAIQNRMNNAPAAPQNPTSQNPLSRFMNRPKTVRPKTETLSDDDLKEMKQNLKIIISTEFANLASQTHLNNANEYVLLDIEKTTSPAFFGAYRNAIGGVVNNVKNMGTKTEVQKAELNKKMVEGAFGQLAERLANNIMSKIESHLVDPANTNHDIDDAKISQIIKAQTNVDINPVSTKFFKMDGIKIGDANCVEGGKSNLQVIKDRISELLLSNMSVESTAAPFDKATWTADLKTLQLEAIKVTGSSVEAFADVTRRKQGAEAVKALAVDPLMGGVTRAATWLTPGNIIANVIIGVGVGAGFGVVKHLINEGTHRTNSETIINNENSINNLDTIFRGVSENGNIITIENANIEPYAMPNGDPIDAFSGELNMDLNNISNLYITNFDHNDEDSSIFVKKIAYLNSFVNQIRTKIGTPEFKTSPSAYQKFLKIESKLKTKINEIRIAAAADVATGTPPNLSLPQNLLDLIEAVNSNFVDKVQEDNQDKVRGHYQNLKPNGEDEPNIIKSNNSLSKEVKAGMIKGGISSALLTARGAVLPYLFQDSAAYGSTGISAPKPTIGLSGSEQGGLSGAKSSIGNAVNGIRQSIPAGMPGHMDKLNPGDNVFDYDGKHPAQSGYHYESTGNRNSWFLGKDGNPLQVEDSNNIVTLEVDGKPEKYLIDNTGNEGKIIGKFGENNKLVDEASEGFNDGFSIKDSKLVAPVEPVNVGGADSKVPGNTTQEFLNPDKIINPDKSIKLPSNTENSFAQTPDGKTIFKPGSTNEPLELDKTQKNVVTTDGKEVIVNKDNKVIFEVDKNGKATVPSKNIGYDPEKNTVSEVDKNGVPTKSAETPKTDATPTEPTPKTPGVKEKFYPGKDSTKVIIEGKEFEASEGKHFEYTSNTDGGVDVLLNSDKTPMELSADQDVRLVGSGENAQLAFVDTKTNKIIGLVNADDTVKSPEAGKVFGVNPKGEIVEVDPADKIATVVTKEIEPPTEPTLKNPEAVETKPNVDKAADGTTKQSPVTTAKTPYSSAGNPELDTTVTYDNQIKTFDPNRYVSVENETIGEYEVKIPKDIDTSGIKQHQYIGHKFVTKDGVTLEAAGGKVFRTDITGKNFLLDKSGNPIEFNKNEYPVYRNGKLFGNPERFTTDAVSPGEVPESQRELLDSLAKRIAELEDDKLKSPMSALSRKK